MFTGLVETTAILRLWEQGPTSQKLALDLGETEVGKTIIRETKIGDSIAISGICLTVVNIEKDLFYFDVLAETRQVTSLKDSKIGDLVNIERSAEVGTRMHGHYVTGHIDTHGKMHALEKRGQDYYMTIQCSSLFKKYLIQKGSIAVEGISLTITDIRPDIGNHHCEIGIWIIPHTLDQTNLKKRIHRSVNLEFDILGKYTESLLHFS